MAFWQTLICLLVLAYGVGSYERTDSRWDRTLYALATVLTCAGLAFSIHGGP